MALRTVNLHKQEIFVSKADPGKGTDDETRFHHRPLDSYEQAYLRDRLSTIERMPTNMKEGMSEAEMISQVKTRTEVHKVAVDAVRIACTNIENLQDHEGKVVEFKTQTGNVAGRSRPVVHDDILRALDIDTCMEFYTEIMTRNQLSPSAEKNSEPASSLSNFSQTSTAKAVTKPKEGSVATTESQS